MRKRILSAALCQIMVIFVFFLSNFSGNRLYAEQAQTGEQFVFELEYSPNGFHTLIDVYILPLNKTFAQEPDLKGKIVRGHILAGSQEKVYIPFIWDINLSRLYVDINRNNDLTDDGANSIFTSRSEPGYGFFNNIQMKFQADSVEIPFVISVTLYDFNLSYSSSYIQSGFIGEIELHGKKWQLAIADNLNGIINSDDYLYLLPAEMNLDRGSQQQSFSAAQTIFIDGHNYTASYEIINKNDKPVLQVTLTESDYSKGEVNIRGKSIRLLTLETDSVLVQLDSPVGAIAVPIGNYSVSDVFLDGGKFGIFRAEEFPLESSKITVAEDQSCDLTIGAPLNNTARISRMGNVITLDYELLGIGKEKYEKITQTLTEAPTLSVFKGDRKIASGKFEFG